MGALSTEAQRSYFGVLGVLHHLLRLLSYQLLLLLKLEPVVTEDVQLYVGVHQSLGHLVLQGLRQ